jgi:inhibitor of cysteine peptidase
MLKRIVKTEILFFALLLILSGCSFSFPWEKERSLGSIDEYPQETEEKNTDYKSESPILDTPQLSGELRKFTGIEALKTFISRFSAPGTDLECLLAEPGYGPGSNLASKDLIDSTVVLKGADIVKTDGDYVYALEKSNLHIIKISSLETAEAVSKITFLSRPLEIAISGNFLVVSGIESEPQLGLGSTPDEKIKYSFLKIYDISNPASPQEIRSLVFAGNYVGLRLSGSYVYFFTTSPLDYQEGREVLPQVLSFGKKLSESCSLNAECLSSNVYYFDHAYDNYNFLSFISIRLADSISPITRQLYLVDSDFNLYISKTDNFYLSRQEFWSRLDLETEVKKEKLFSVLNSEDKAKIENIENSPSFLLRDDEKRQKIGIIIDDYFSSLSQKEQIDWQEEIDSALEDKVKSWSDKLDNIDIYKFSIHSGKLDYQAKGQISGRFLRFNSFDEEDGYLRVATVRGELWPLLFTGEKKNYSNIYILDNILSIRGSLENIVTDSVIENVIFVKERAYLTTSDQSAPTYVIDLATKDSPSILGALQIGAYAYFYPADEEGKKLIALGRNEIKVDSDETNGLKLSLFDFSDLQKPQELSSYVIGDGFSNSVSLSDYKSFSNILKQKTVIFPASFKDDGVLVFSGALVFTFNNEGKLSLQYQIDHSANGYFETSDSWRGFSYYDNTVKRSFISDNNLFTFSNKYLKINNLVSGEELSSIILKPSSEDELIRQEEENKNNVSEENLIDEESVSENNSPTLIDSIRNCSAGESNVFKIKRYLPGYGENIIIDSDFQIVSDGLNSDNLCEIDIITKSQNYYLNDQAIINDEDEEAWYRELITDYEETSEDIPRQTCIGPSNELANFLNDYYTVDYVNFSDVSCSLSTQTGSECQYPGGVICSSPVQVINYENN